MKDIYAFGKNQNAVHWIYVPVDLSILEHDISRSNYKKSQKDMHLVSTGWMDGSDDMLGSPQKWRWSSNRDYRHTEGKYTFTSYSYK